MHTHTSHSHIHTRARSHTHTHTRSHTHARIHARAHTHALIHTHANTHANTHAHAHIHAHTHARIHTRTRARMHTHTSHSQTRARAHSREHTRARTNLYTCCTPKYFLANDWLGARIFAVHLLIFSSFSELHCKGNTYSEFSYGNFVILKLGAKSRVFCSVQPKTLSCEHKESPHQVLAVSQVDIPN